MNLKAPLFTALLLGTAVSIATADDKGQPTSPGYVDGSAFATLAGPDSQLVEVNIPVSLLRALARGAEKDKDAAEMLRQLESVHAVIVGLDKDPGRVARAEKMVADLEAQLRRTGWEPLARVRESGEKVAVFVRNNDKTIDGLTVLVFDRGESQLVFANISGVIDLERIGALADTFDIPGLDDIGNAHDEKGDHEDDHDEGSDDTGHGRTL
jgi:hypothetical protein